MTTTSASALQTPIHGRHIQAGAQMVEFGGWHMPLQYSSMRAEHVAVRERAGLFDVSHMGEFRIAGPEALSTLERTVTNRVSDLEPGQARYTLICNPDAGIIDDALVYRQAVDRFLVVVNAGPRPADLEHFRTVAQGRCEVEDLTFEVGLLALQGPLALEALQPLTGTRLQDVPYYHFVEDRLAGVPATLSRTGYTGEDGFEVFVSWADAATVWDTILDVGAPARVQPCGLGARDTLRMEASMRLSGQDIDTTTNPLEAGLGWAVKLDKDDFIGRDALLKVKQEGPRRSFIGLELEGRAIARHEHPILDGGSPAGKITSGTFSFTLGKGIAMGYVETTSKDSRELSVEVRGAPVAAHRTPLPFYKRPRN